MKKEIGTFILWIFGWKSKFPDEFKISKMVMVAAPFTSAWDLFFVIATYWKEGLNPNFLVSNKYAEGVFGIFFKWIGGIGVDKTKGTTIDFAVNLFKTNSKLLLLVSPEGTRSKVDKWHTGFYQIATQANVPICLGHLDYKEKVAYIGNVYNVTGNFEKCMTFLQNECEKIPPKHPTRYNKKIF